MKNYRIILIATLVVSFLAGTASGFWGSQKCLQRRFFKGHDSQQFKSRLLTKLDRALQLDEKQRASISAILEDSAKEHKGVMEDFKSKMKGLRAKNFEKIKRHLTEEQREKLERLQKKMEKRREERRARNTKGGRPDEKCL